MKRREILTRRQYAAIPKATLARTDLTASAKIVYASLIGHLFSDEADRAYPSTATLAQTAGIGRRTVIRALADLQTAGLITANTHPGRPTVYTFPAADRPPNEKPPGQKPQDAGANLAHPPAPRQPLEPDDGPSETDAKSAHPRPEEPESYWHTPPVILAHPRPEEPEPEMPGTPAKLPTTCAKNGGAYKEEERLKERSEEPPLPPRERIGPSQENPNGDGPTLQETIEAIGDAYREATGRRMPGKWEAAIGREYDRGDREILGEMTAAAIRDAQRFAQERRLAFAFGTVVLAIHQRPLIDASAFTAARAAEQAEALAATMAHLDSQRHEAEAGRRQAELEYFRTLDPDTRHRWIDATAGRPGVSQCGPDALESLAAQRAHAAQKQTPPEQRRARARA